MEKRLMPSPLAREFSRRLVAIVLVCLLPATVLAQETSALKLRVISGMGAVNDLRTNTTVPTIVELRDDRDQPVIRGAVNFMLPESGPGGRFADGSRSSFVLTDRSGRATLTGFIPNRMEGPFQIAVEASFSGNSVRTMIRQYNNSLPVYSAPRQSDSTPAAGRGSGKSRKILPMLFLAGAVAVVSIAAIKHRGNGNTPPTTTISIGGVSVGGPR
jgi:hypothetical protein